LHKKVGLPVPHTQPYHSEKKARPSSEMAEAKSPEEPRS
jgi:hypothetical protein